MTPADEASTTSAPSTEASGAHRQWPWVVLAVLWAAYFAVAWLDAPTVTERVLKGLLMPVLLVAALIALGDARPRTPLPVWLVAGLVFATVGDIAIDVRFEAGLAGFLVMQICYIVGFVGLGALAGLRTRWWAALGYGLLWIGINVFLGPTLGALQVPVLVYSAAICVMAALGAGVSTRVGFGALLFVISDSLIALGEADVHVAGRAYLVMPTYLLGQYLIATGWVRRVNPKAWLPL